MKDESITKSDGNVTNNDSMLGELREAWKYAQKDRYKKIGPWTFDRWIFTLAMLAIFGWLAFVGYSFNWDLDYYYCETPGGSAQYFVGGGAPVVRPDQFCTNPFFKPATWKNSEFLLPGEYGTKPGPLFNSIYYIPVVALLLAFFINYIIHNRNLKTLKGAKKI